MTFRVAAGSIVVRDDRLLLVRLGREEGSHFWIPPGGGMEISEGAFACAERETFEETGLRVRAQRIAYIQEILDKQHHHVKFWVLCADDGGEPHLDNRVPEEIQDLHEARFVSREEMASLRVVPPVLQGEFWDHLAEGFTTPRYLGVTEARFS